ncbi:MAG: UPF0182 family protein [Elusimicrobia bacterium]|nr:UPF0182 family protein [Elusimicrobiota bacterium]
MPKSFSKLSVVVYFFLFLGLSLITRAVGLIVDYFWFNEVGLTTVFLVSFLSKWGLGISCAVLAWLALFLNLRLAQKLAGKGSMVLSEEETAELPNLGEFREAAQPILLLGSVLVAFFIGTWAASNWQDVLKFWQASPFGARDPVFHRDIGFYVFTVPFYRFLQSLFQAILALSGLLAIAVYVLGGKLLLTNRGIRVSPHARDHLVVLGGMLCLLAAFHFQLKIYDLLNIQRAVAPGPGYSDLNAYLPALKILRFAAFVSALLFWISPFSRLRLVLAGAGLLAGGSLLSVVYSGIVQRFVVAPNEIVKETPYIQRAIQHTREAFGIVNVQELEFDPAENLTTQALRRNDLTVKNIRLWDHAPLKTTYGQLQEIRTYYDFLDVDNDRYLINGEYRQVMLSPRELDPASLPSRSWINEHLAYTHGYGLTLGPVNSISPEGLPEFFIKDIPPRSATGLKITRPEIYYGEAKGSYVIVKTRSKEFDYPSGDENIYTRYAGAGGVGIGGFLRKLLFAIHFREIKILFSGDITPESRILFHRNIQGRLSRAAPFLRYDQDPYMVISREGKLHWIVDAYTTTDRYPYSESINGIGNYIRNSVKVVVDAYNGSLAFYVSDESDPIVRTYGKIFPGVFKPISEMPEDLRSHIRYPQDLFSLQADIYGTYHMTDPQVFYNKEDLWKIPEKSFGNQVQKSMAPYYTIMKLASVGDREEFILMVPFTPARKENMIAWMAARCDAPNYGKLLVYNFPKQKLVYGPQQIESRIDQESEISKQLSLWNQGGSKVLRGSLLVIPIENSLIYVQPLYLEATGGGLPELKRVIVAYGNVIAMEENLEESLNRIFGGRAAMPGSGTPPSAGGPGLKDLARQARERFEKAQSHLKRGDLAAYGNEIKEVERLIRKMSETR